MASCGILISASIILREPDLQIAIPLHPYLLSNVTIPPYFDVENVFCTLVLRRNDMFHNTATIVPSWAHVSWLSGVVCCQRHLDRNKWTADKKITDSTCKCGLNALLTPGNPLTRITCTLLPSRLLELPPGEEETHSITNVINICIRIFMVVQLLCSVLKCISAEDGVKTLQLMLPTYILKSQHCATCKLSPSMNQRISVALIELKPAMGLSLVLAIQQSTHLLACFCS